MDVLDASVALKWVLDETDSDRAHFLLDEFQANLRDFIAPDIFAVECAHVLTKAERRGLIENTTPLYREVMLYAPRLVPSLPLMGRAIEIARNARSGVYDCLYVALAEREGCEFITADERLIRVLQREFPFLVPLASRP